MNNKRDFSIDVLRALGVLLIVLAHINPPKVLFQLRNFDVPFMVILSGYLFSKSSSESKIGIEYVWKRFKRLVVPVWVFLIVIFYGGGILKQYPFTVNQIATSFALWSGIGYVWIIRIYLIVAVFGPWASKKVENKIENLFLYYILSEGLIFLAMKIVPSNFLLNGVLINIPYILFFVYGVNFRELQEKFSSKNKVFNLSLILLLVLGTTLQYVSKNSESRILNLQNFKYPPRLYYVFYALLVSNILLTYKSKLEVLNRKVIGDIISFIGNSTMWIYLWHIPPVMALQLLGKKGINISWIPALVLVFLFAVVVTYIQQRFFKFIIDKFLKDKPVWIKNIKIIFMS